MCKPWGQGTQAEGLGPAALCSLSLGCFRRSRREDSPSSVITSCPGWEKAPGGKGDGAAALLVSLGCPSLPVGLGPRGGRVLGPWPMSLVPAPPAPRKLPGLALLGVGSPAWQPRFQTWAQPSHFSLGSGVSPPSFLGTGWGAGR